MAAALLVDAGGVLKHITPLSLGEGLGVRLRGEGVRLLGVRLFTG